jgi:hypothetical protein
MNTMLAFPPRYRPPPDVPREFGTRRVAAQTSLCRNLGKAPHAEAPKYVRGRLAGRFVTRVWNARTTTKDSNPMRMVPPLSRLLWTAILGATAVRCTTVETPRLQSSQIFVTNSTCGAGHCEHLIVGIVSGAISPGGHDFFTIGEVDTGTACFDLPDSATINGIRWTLGSPTTLTALPILPGASFTQTVQIGFTRSFVPAMSSLWEVDFPSAELGAIANAGCGILNQ